MRSATSTPGLIVQAQPPVVHPLSLMAGKPATQAMLVEVPRLVTAYYTDQPDFSSPEQRVVFGTSGYRGSAFERVFNEWHVVAISQAICQYRMRQGHRWPTVSGHR